jgi:hypothetical protein
MRVANEGKTVPPKKADSAAVTAALKELIAARNPSIAGDAVFGPTLSYVAGLVASLQVSSSNLYWYGSRMGSTGQPLKVVCSVPAVPASGGVCSSYLCHRNVVVLR